MKRTPTVPGETDVSVTGRPAIRPRLRAAALLLVVIAVGIASREFHLPLPPPLAKRVGDALWATAGFVAVRAARPRWSTATVAGVALAGAVAVEFSQAYHQPALDRFRSHGVGHLLLGSGFSWLDLPAYAVGVAIAWPADRLLRQR